jgi:predicted kinase
MLIAMAGLPGTGKSTLAVRIAQGFGGVVLSKDEVRATFFPSRVLDYSSEQDDLCMAAIYSAATYILKSNREQTVILDGRTFLRAYQVRTLLDAAASANEPLRIIECVCADEVARQRLEADQAQNVHPAKNRSYALYLAVKDQAEPIRVPHLLLDTGALSLEQCVERCLAYLRGDSGD